MSRIYPNRGQHGRAVHAIGLRIVSGEWPVGEPLPTEEALVAELDVGRSALREAMKVLAGKGLLETRTRAGTLVRHREAWNLMDPDVLGWQFERQPSVRNLDDLSQLRVVLEPAAARMAATHADEAAVKEIANAFADMESSAGDPEAFIVADLAFHAVIFAATGNELLVHLNEMMAVAMSAHRHVHTDNPRTYRRTLPDHERVLDAIRRHHAGKAETLMRALVEQARRDVLNAAKRAETKPPARRRRGG